MFPLITKNKGNPVQVALFIRNRTDDVMKLRV